MPTPTHWPRAALLGAGNGLRTFTPAAALALRGRIAQPTLRYGALIGAAGELVFDKIPGVPDRTSHLAWPGRVLGGALCGRAIAGAPGAGVGALAAGASTVLSYHARRLLGERTGTHDVAFAVAEDALAISLASVATRPGHVPGLDPSGGTPTAREVTPPGAVARGLIAGVAATGAMTAAQLAVLRLKGGSPSDTPARVGERILNGVFGRRVKRREKPALNQIMHWLYGTSWGIPLGVVAAAGGRERPGVLRSGALHGLTVWGASLVELPALGVAPPIWEEPPSAIAQDVGFHLVYGLAAAGVLRALP